MTAAKKGGRAEKAVLSRQEIATKRKALANKKMKAGGAASPARRALVGVFVLERPVILAVQKTFGVQANQLSAVAHVVEALSVHRGG